MSSTSLGAIALENYRSEEEAKLLDVIDNLRPQGLCQHISLPQLIVCGNQSSGKSSVLEAISGAPFPTNDNLCTRFPTEVILRRSATPRIEVTISPGQVTNESPELKAKILRFRESLTSFEDFPALIQRVKDVMEVGSGRSNFSNDVLRVKVSGPNRPLLTLVDLPGLFRSREKQHGGESRDQVRQMVKRYMSDPRSIILAVVSAKDDIANQ